MFDKPFFEFFNEIENARAELNCSKTGAFYRGHSENSHKLVPSLLRSDYSFQKEHNLYLDCFARARGLMSESNNSWEFLSIMQHYGIPTRLLDWSESLATAIFFALTEPYTKPQIWITNAFNFNQRNKITEIPKIITVGKDALDDYEKCFIKNEKKWQFDKPVFMQIPWTNQRIINQKGFFTFHSNETPIEENCKRYVRCVPINEDVIPSLIKFLDYSGVGADSVFADLESFGKYIKKKYNAK